LRDAVLGEPADTRDDTRSDVPAGTARDTAYTEPDRGHVAADPAPADPSRSDTARDPGYTDQDRGATSDPGRADTDRDYGSYEQAMREHVGGGAVPDPVRDDVAQDTTARDVRGPGDGGSVGGAPATAGREGGDDRDFVTGSYDPGRDTGYDPKAAGTAMAGTGGGTTAEQGRDYDPTQDTGYVDRGRADADRSTGHRDADYDTGRVDADRVDSGRDTDRHAGGTRFSEVDDTATVDDTSTGRSTPDRAAVTDTGRDDAMDRRAEAVADEGTENRRERLVPADRAQDYSSRWDALKGDFVDEPRRAVRQADELVGELLDEMQQLFARQRRDLEQGLDHDRASTEDLRLALRRYRSFFDRLLSF
jgi:hypothetical protein